MCGERDLVDAVRRLGEQSYGQQMPEIPQAQEYAQITHDRHVCKRHIRRGPLRRHGTGTLNSRAEAEA